MSHRSGVVAAVVILLAFSVPAGAGVLTWQILQGGVTVPDNTAIDQTYGDRITAFSSGNFTYGSAGGLTPNVLVAYNSNLNPPTTCPFGGSSTPCDYLYHGSPTFGDLPAALAQGAESGGSVGTIILTFTADSGFVVSLTSLNIAGWGGFTSGNQSINGVRVLDGSNNVLFNSGSLSVAFNTTSHLTVSPGVSSQVLQLIIDASNLSFGAAENIGIDNVQFSQAASSVPEPTTFALLGCGLAALGLARRRRARS